MCRVRPQRSVQLQQDTAGLSEKEIQDLLNQMWRNACINDTYEPGSTFKIITMSAGLSRARCVADDSFSVPATKSWRTAGSTAKRTGHEPKNFVQGAQNSYNPVFIEVGCGPVWKSSVITSGISV